MAYTPTPKDGGVFFEREFIYPMPNVLFAIVDALVYRRRVQAESEQALRELKRLLESV